MARKNIDKRIEQATLETTKLVQKMQELKASGQEGTEAFIKLAQEAQAQLKTLAGLSDSIKRSFDQTKNVKQFEKDVKTVGQNIQKVTKVQKDSSRVVEKEERKSLERRQRIQTIG